MRFLKIFIYVWLHWAFIATLVFSSYSEQGLLIIVVRGLLIAVAFPVVEHGL